MQVRDGMSKVVLTVGPGHSLRDAARAMNGRGTGAAVVLDPDQPGPGPATAATARRSTATPGSRSSG